MTVYFINVQFMETFCKSLTENPSVHEVTVRLKGDLKGAHFIKIPLY